MKTLSNQGFLPIQLSIFVLVFFSCSSPTTSMRHGNDFSNIRSEVILNNGNSVVGYTSYKGMSGPGQVTMYLPAERKEVKFSLSEIERMKVEDHEYLVKMIVSPYNARKNGAGLITKAMVRRLGMEKDPIQVFEYKYEVKNPKSPLHSIETAWFVSFPDDIPDRPLIQMGSQTYKAKWSEFVFDMQQQNVVIEGKAPASPKILLDHIKDIPVTKFSTEDLATPGS
jgi:hypothetical protein